MLQIRATGQPMPIEEDEFLGKNGTRVRARRFCFVLDLESIRAWSGAVVNR
jgi:hypothetical protein